VVVRTSGVLTARIMFAGRFAVFAGSDKLRDVLFNRRLKLGDFPRYRKRFCGPLQRLAASWRDALRTL
jgi:hypothetical protein